MTVNEVLKVVIPVLERIKVPVTEVEEIGMPIANAVKDLRACVRCLDNIEKETAEKAAQEANKAEDENREEGGEENEERADV